MILNDKVAIVTGAASGIGKASALALAREGAAVVVADIDGAGLEATAAAITGQGGRTAAIIVDVRRDADMAAMVALAVSRFGRLDIACNVAGGGDRRGPLATLDGDDYDVMVDLNLKGTFLAMRHQLGRIAAQGEGGAIVNVSSTAGLRGVRDSSLYSAAKHGVIGLTRCAALDYAYAGIRVNAVCPGAIETPQFDRVLAARFPTTERLAALDAVGALYPLGRLGAPHDVSELVLWLASDKSGYVTGQAMAVDGGFTA